MSMFSIFNVSGSAVSAQSQRLNVVASNLANADAVAGPDGQGYKARQVVFQTVPMGSDSRSRRARSVPSSESNEPLGRVHNPATRWPMRRAT
jgi:flagellar basal-body rod protein FlgC